MKWGEFKGERIEAKPKLKATCGCCNQELIPKCGKIKIWHWAHKNLEECDNWYEPESAWHLDWKDCFPKENQEVVIGKHRADIRTNARWIIELQNSSISSEDIVEREKYYKRMVWVLNRNTLGENIEVTKNKDSFVGFKWKWFPKSWLSAKKDIYVDYGDELLHIKKIYENKKNKIHPLWNGEEYEKVIKKYPVSGWGYVITKEDFLKKFGENGNTNSN